MCLELNINKTKRIKATNKKSIFAYKALIKVYKGFVSPYESYSYKDGENVSSRKYVGLSANEIMYGEISEGFHCYVSLSDLIKMEKIFRESFSVFKVKINPKDLVAYGKFHNCPSLVCTKLTIDLNKPQLSI